MVESAFVSCLEEAVSHYLDTPEVEVNLEKEKVTAFLKVGKNLGLEEARVFDEDARPGDFIPMTFDFPLLPDKVKKEVKERFPEIVISLKEDITYRDWKEKVHRAVEGVVVEKDNVKLEVNLGGEETGIMPRREWTPKEIPLYREGKCFLFYVLKVEREKGLVKVFLSRRSINLPVAFLRQKMPWAKIRCVRRIAGVKSWIVSDTEIKREHIEELREELRGEFIEVETLKIRLISL